jgi:hypothetical protein
MKRTQTSNSLLQQYEISVRQTDYWRWDEQAARIMIGK